MGWPHVKYVHTCVKTDIKIKYYSNLTLTMTVVYFIQSLLIQISMKNYLSIPSRKEWII